MSAPHILVDADACPVVRETEALARCYGLPMTLLCDEHHVMYSDYAQVRHVSSGADAVDIALMNLCCRGDLVVTQDYGVAAMALGKGAYAIHHTGKRYTDDNIDLMLMERHLAKKARRASARHHQRGPAKFTDADQQCFSAALERMILIAMQATNENGGTAP